MYRYAICFKIKITLQIIMYNTEFKIHVLFAKKYTKLDKRTSKDCHKVFMVFCRKKLEHYLKKSSFRTRTGNILYQISTVCQYTIYKIYNIVSSIEEQKCVTIKKVSYLVNTLHAYFHLTSLTLHKNITLLC